MNELRATGQDARVITGCIGDGCEDGFVIDSNRYRATRGLATRIADAVTYRLLPKPFAMARRSREGCATVARVVRQERLDLLEMEEVDGFAAQVADVVGVPVIVRLHGPWFITGHVLGVPADALFNRRVAAEGHGLCHVAAVSSPSADVLQQTRHRYGLELPDARVIPNPIPPTPPERRWSRRSAEPGHVLFVGRFDRIKGGDVALEAFGSLAARDPGCRLTFVGPDRGFADDSGKRWGFEEFMSSRLTDPSVRDRVAWLGQQPLETIQDLRQKAAVTMICSRYENFPMALLEATSTGCPVVGAAVGGVPEIIEDGRNGLLCRPGDPVDLAEKILTLLRDPALAERLGARAAIDTEARFHPRIVAELTLDFYHQTLSRFRRPGLTQA